MFNLIDWKFMEVYLLKKGKLQENEIETKTNVDTDNKIARPLLLINQTTEWAMTYLFYCIIFIYIITKSKRALWLVNQLWFIVPANIMEKSRVL